MSHNTGVNQEGQPVGDVTYRFEYDELGAQTQVKVEDQVLSTNEYSTDRSHKLMHTTFANGGSIHNKYDEFDRLVELSYDDPNPDADLRYSYAFGANGQVAQLKDHHLDRTQWTEYDLADRPIRTTTRDDESGELVYQTTLKYEKFNRLRKFREDTGNASYLTQYAYDNDNRTTKVIYGKAEAENRHVAYSYDGLGRIASQTVTNGAGNAIVSSNTFVAGDTAVHGSGATTPLVDTLTHKRGTVEMLKLQYAYDETGNIQTETRTEKVGTSTAVKTTGYEYDPIGQLTRVNDQSANETWAYEYDLGGNIKRKRKYAYTTADLDGRTPVEDIQYKYNRIWKDKLDSYNGKWIGYDRIGNPLSYDNWTYDWQAGRLLKQMTQWAAAPDKPKVYGEVSVDGATMVAKHVRGANDAGHTLSLSNAELYVNAAGYRLENGELYVDYEQQGAKQQTIEFSYNPNGLRTRKKVTIGSTVTTTDYILHGKLLMELRQGTDALHFFYDAQSRPMMVKYGGDYYTYLHSLQGDILAIVDSAGAKVVEYKYNAWGKPVGSTQGTMAATLGKLNPFRYRGYLFDEETQLYYLRSRYYNPEWGRFLNEDSLLGKIGALLSHNVFEYCRNNPVMLNDPSGRDFISWIKDAFNNVIKNVVEYQMASATVGAKMDLHAARNTVNAAGRTALKALGAGSTAQDVFSHFLFGEGADLSLGTKAGLADLMRQSGKLRQVILRDSLKQGINIVSSLEFPTSELDLNLAVGKARYEASLYRIDGVLHAAVVVSDTGDFDEWRIHSRGFSISNLANDVGYSVQQLGLSTPFDWSVQFTMALE